jgi:hypothetical protein
VGSADAGGGVGRPRLHRDTPVVWPCIGSDASVPAVFGGQCHDGTVRRSIDHGFDDHPEDDDDRPPAAWAVAIADDCDACADMRVVLTAEERGRPGSGLALHLAPGSARRLRVAIADALKELGEQT